MNLLQSRRHSTIDNDYYLAAAFALSHDEKMTSELQLWIQAERDLALRLFGQVVTLADRAAAERRYEDVLQLLARAMGVGLIDAEVTKRCDWLSLNKRLRALAPSLEPGSKKWCLDMAKRSASMNQSPIEKKGKSLQ
jgi:hypothetical protein